MEPRSCPWSIKLKPVFTYNGMTFNLTARKRAFGLWPILLLVLAKKSLLSDPTISSIAQTKGVYPSQVALRFLIQKGYAVLPMSSFKQRLALNLDLFSFELDTDEVSILDKLALEMDEGIGLPSPYDMS